MYLLSPFGNHHLIHCLVVFGYQRCKNLKSEKEDLEKCVSTAKTENSSTLQVLRRKRFIRLKLQSVVCHQKLEATNNL